MADFIYNKNDVMQMIGRQRAAEYMGGGEIANKDFMKVVEAHRTAKNPSENEIYTIGMDFFALGMIYGRKEERAKRNHKPIEPISKEANNDRKERF